MTPLERAAIDFVNAYVAAKTDDKEQHKHKRLRAYERAWKHLCQVVQEQTEASS